MAEEKVEFELVSPERLLMSQAVDMVVVPGEEGDFGVLVQHAPLISAVRPGVIAVHDGGKVTVITEITHFRRLEETQRLTKVAEQSGLLATTVANIAQGVVVFDPRIKGGESGIVLDIRPCNGLTEARPVQIRQTPVGLAVAGIM